MKFDRNFDVEDIKAVRTVKNFANKHDIKGVVKKYSKKVQSVAVIASLGVVCTASITAAKQSDVPSDGRVISISDVKAEADVFGTGFDRVSYEEMKGLRYESDQYAKIEVSEKNYEAVLLAKDADEKNKEALRKLNEENEERIRKEAEAKRAEEERIAEEARRAEESRKAEEAAKSEDVKAEETVVEETQDDEDETDNSYDVGDTVTFTVKTTIPTFADVYTDPTFKITDEMSDGLIITSGSFVVKVDGEEVDDLEVSEDSTTSWSLDLTGTHYLKAESPAPIEITYEAVLTKSAFSSVNEETNDVKVEFSNNPDNQQDKGTVKDKTRTYTFSIDGNLLGKSGVRTSELVKVAVDGNGNPIIQASATGETYENALAGAKFGLYTDEACAHVYTNKAGGAEKTWDNIITDKNGYMEINGLDAGTYYLKELSAPAGCIADQKIHKIVISAEYDTETVTEGGYTYDLPKLKSYTITIDDATTSTYNMTLKASSITTSEATNLPTSIMNTKGIELPSTGGIGTTIFYIIGSVLVIGAGVVMVTRRRMNAN